jgi:arsenical-resistance protein 2
MASQQQASTAAPWHAAYPAPERQPGSLTREEVLKLIKEVSSVAKQDFVLIDLRRNDHEVSLALLPLGIDRVLSQCR